MLTVTLLLLLAAYVAAVVSAIGKCPLWVAVILVVVALLLRELPL